MDNLLRMFSDNPIVSVAVLLVILFLLYWIFKKIVLLALILVIAVMAVGGYFYFKDPKRMPENMLDAMKKAKVSTEKAVEKGRAVLDTGKEMMEKGKDVYQKGKDTTERMGNLFKPKEGEKEEKKPQKP